MSGTRYNLVPEAKWATLGDAFRGLDSDLKTLETSGVPATGNIDAGQITSGVVAPNRLGSGTPDASKVLFGDGTWKTAPTGGGGTASSVAWADITGKPTFSSVATSGSYADLANKPDLNAYAPRSSPTFTGTVTFTSATIEGAALPASAITSGVLNTARLGTGFASSSTALFGDGTWKTIPASDPVTSDLTTVYNTAKA